jgi:hypothetical protein
LADCSICLKWCREKRPGETGTNIQNMVLCTRVHHMLGT